ncbi:MAG: hypothetical protein GY913_19345 [Proteobacteria bacterium]|nr:hypothetical protein [Pseudomonadota bacterium]MCP4919066.1 hypothetical protein [Pseudomonadota bacterium]
MDSDLWSRAMVSVKVPASTQMRSPSSAASMASVIVAKSPGTACPSIRPSQSLSAPSQTSGAGERGRAQVVTVVLVLDQLGARLAGDDGDVAAEAVAVDVPGVALDGVGGVGVLVTAGGQEEKKGHGKPPGWCPRGACVRLGCDPSSI